MSDLIDIQAAIGGTTLEESVKALQDVFADHDLAEKGEPMPRLIDADALLEGREDHEMISTHLIWNAPTIDAVEVVRKQIPGYEGMYEVDNLSRVFSIYRCKIVDDNGRVYNKTIRMRQLRQAMHSKGYKVVSLTKDGKTETLYVHRIVANAFVDNPNKLPMVNHKDEDKTNNLPENLEWCDAKYNTNYGNGRKKQANKIRGRHLSEEHKAKISSALKETYKRRKTDDA